MKKTYKVIKANNRFKKGDSVELSESTAEIFKKGKIIAEDDEGEEIEGVDYKNASESDSDDLVSDLKDKLKSSEEDVEELKSELESVNTRIDALVKENKALVKENEKLSKSK